MNCIGETEINNAMVLNVEIDHEKPWYTAKKTHVGFETEILQTLIMRDCYIVKKNMHSKNQEHVILEASLRLIALTTR